MKFNIACPATANDKKVEVDDEKRLLPFLEKRIGHEVPGDSLGPEFKGYTLKITGGNDKQGFPMMQGIISNHRVRLLFRKGMPCFRERRRGAMKRKSVRGCIVGSDISALNLKIVKKGPEDIIGFTDADSARPKSLGPKRASKIRKMFGLSKTEDLTAYVVRREVKPGKFKSPKIQRLVTDKRIARKKREMELYKQRRIRSRNEYFEYRKVMKEYTEKKQADKVAVAEANKFKREKMLARKQKQSKLRAAVAAAAKPAPAVAQV